MKNSRADEAEQKRIDDGWMSRERSLVLVLTVATALAFYVCYRLARPFLPALAWALALAVIAHPVHQWVARRVKSANLAAGLAVTLVAVVLIAPAVFVAQHLAHEVVAGAQTIKAGIEGGEWQARFESDKRLAPVLALVEGQIDLKGEIQRLASGITARISSFVAGTLLADSLVRPAGEKGLEKFVKPERVRRLKQMLKRSAGWAIFLASLCPPPFPFRAVVLTASALQSPRATLLTAVFLGRLVRFTAEALLILYFGRALFNYMNSRFFEYAVYVLVAVALVGSILAVRKWLS